MKAEPRSATEARVIVSLHLLRPAAAFACLALIAAGCRGTPAAPLPPPPGRVRISMTEFKFDRAHYGRLASATGRFVFRVSNTGRIEHQVTLSQLPPEMPGTIREQLRSETRRAIRSLVRTKAVRAGGNATFAVDLPPGRYALICFLRDSAGVPHALKGMASEFTVAGPAPGDG